MLEKALLTKGDADRFYLRASANKKFRLNAIRDLQTMSFEWAYRIHNRQMWVSSEN